MAIRSLEERPSVTMPRSADTSGLAASPSPALTLEDQLASIIISARNVAVAAEELLREISVSGATANAAAGRSAPHAIAVAPRLLAATEQQLLSVSAMLRKI